MSYEIADFGEKFFCCAAVITTFIAKLDYYLHKESPNILNWLFLSSMNVKKKELEIKLQTQLERLDKRKFSNKKN